MMQLMQSAPTRYASRDNMVAMGRYFVMRGEDARQVLELFYDRVRDSDPTHLDCYLASAELALSKNDYQVAAETLRKAEELGANDPYVHYLSFRAWETSDSEKAGAALLKALELNPNHVPSLLATADGAIDREQYEVAEESLKRVLEINSKEQEAWALKAVLAHLRGDFEGEAKSRETALSTWKDNPRVDSLIGKKLSQKYRFEQGAEYQRRAIESDSSYLPAKLLLAQDLLRLGHEENGWEMARRVANDDPYNVVANNLINLNSRIQSFEVLQEGDIHVRMESGEAGIYGSEVLELLRDAKETLCKKYEVEPRAPIVVEIFPEQKDFAIRTFGLPGGAGFLGVCFGRVITANSPASQGDSPSNWRSVLWHEFCHVVTLEKTKNRMPRWLSEGISVYEERQRDPSWGESINPVYREMLLSDELTPVSQLSGAFLNPKTPIHLQFAYFESSLVVEYLVERHGIEVLKRILDDLGQGLVIDDALTKNVGSPEKLDAEFADFARGVAENFGSKLDWSKESLPEKPSEQELKDWVLKNPNSYWGLRGLAEIYIASEQYESAKEVLEKLIEFDGVTGESGDPLSLLGRVYAELGEPEKERQMLERRIALTSNALPALRRLIELSREGQQWDRVAMFAEQVLAINPLLTEGHEALAEASAELDRPRDVMRGLSALAKMDPVDPAAIDFKLATAYWKLEDREQAKHHVLRALEEAPRYRDAHRLLLELAESETPTTESDATTDVESVTQPQETAP
jgi:tetratricopeptide (TPR) repeat protein